MTRPNISTSHLVVVKNRLALEGTKRILSFVYRSSIQLRTELRLHTFSVEALGLRLYLLLDLDY
jgi:hypothetical protein